MLKLNATTYSKSDNSFIIMKLIWSKLCNRLIAGNVYENIKKTAVVSVEIKKGFVSWDKYQSMKKQSTSKMQKTHANRFIGST